MATRIPTTIFHVPSRCKVRYNKNKPAAIRDISKIVRQESNSLMITNKASAPFTRQ